MSCRGLIEGWSKRNWWLPRPNAACIALSPIAMVVQWLARRLRSEPTSRLPVPVIVVGNITVGGAGKTPTVIAVVEWLKAQGQRPGVISRGYGRDSDQVSEVTVETDARLSGDEPLLIHRRTGVPLFVGRRRVEAAHALLKTHPDVSVLVSDDGLQHRSLARDLQIIVFDERGIGNGLTLPAGPLREPFAPLPPAHSVVLYNAQHPTTPWPGQTSQKQLAVPSQLAPWWRGALTKPKLTWDALAALSQADPICAMAGTAAPERFFLMLEARGLKIKRLPQPDHAHYTDALPWPPGTKRILVTEKDAVKLAALNTGDVQVLVVPLDFALPVSVTDAIANILSST